MRNSADHWTHQGISLFTHAGERKYLNLDERRAFCAAVPSLEDPHAQTFCEMLYWTGCRPSEALALTAGQIDLQDRLVVLRSLKKRSTIAQFRPVPVPSCFLDRLKDCHEFGEPSAKLWSFGRTTAWKYVAEAMYEAEITGARASARGLRHSMGVTATLSGIPITRIQRWLGHADIAVTSIYLDVAAQEDRQLAGRMWRAAEICPKVGDGRHQAAI